AARRHPFRAAAPGAEQAVLVDAAARRRGYASADDERAAGDGEPCGERGGARACGGGVGHAAPGYVKDDPFRERPAPVALSASWAAPARGPACPRFLPPIASSMPSIVRGRPAEAARAAE